jgi:hypothetical protein
MKRRKMVRKVRLYDVLCAARRLSNCCEFVQEPDFVRLVVVDPSDGRAMQFVDDLRLALRAAGDVWR